MKTFWIVLTIVNLSTIGIQLVRERELCPFACRVDANGIKGAWYETNLPGLQRTLWVSDAQKNLTGARP
jgi:hypothetical protein